MLFIWKNKDLEDVDTGFKLRKNKTKKKTNISPRSLFMIDQVQNLYY